MEQENKQLDIRRYTQLLLRGKWLLIVPTIIFGIVGIIYALRLPDVYQSKCVMSVEKSAVLSNVLKNSGGRLSARSVIQVVRERMLGWQPVIQVIHSVGLDKDIPQDDPGSIETLYREMIKDVSLKAKGPNLIEISFRGENPDTTFRVVDGLVSNFMESSLKLTRTSADETVDFIKEDLKRLKRNLDESEKLLLVFEEKHLDELPGSENSKMSRLAGEENEYERNKATLMILNEKLSFIEERMDKEAETVVSEVVRVPNPKVDKLNMHINGLEIQLSTLRAKYYDEHPSIVTTLKSIDQLKEMLERVEERIVSEETIVNNPARRDMLVRQFQGQLEIKAIQRRQIGLKRKIEVLKEEVSHMPLIRQELAELSRGYDVSKQMYGQRLLQKSKAALMREMSLDSKTMPYNVVEPPRVSYEPLKIDKLKIMAMGVLLGASLGVGLIFGLDKIDNRFKSVDEIQEYLNIPTLGVVPLIVTNVDAGKQVRKKKLWSARRQSSFL